MFGLGMGEIIVLAVLGLILIGPDQLPEIARTLGRFLNDFKRATEGLTDDLKKQAKVDLNLDHLVKTETKPYSEEEYNNLIKKPDESVPLQENKMSISPETLNALNNHQVHNADNNDQITSDTNNVAQLDLFDDSIDKTQKKE